MQELNKIWMNGKFIDWKDANIHVLSHTLHYGSGVFEGIRAYKTKENKVAVFHLSKHIDRLFYSAYCLEITIPFSKKEIEQAILDTIKINRLKECYIRPIVFLGYGMGLHNIGVQPNVAIAAWFWDAYLGGKESINVKISKYIRIHPKSTISDAKICGHYVNSILPTIEVKKHGFDEALLLDFEGNVAEGPGENIFIVKEGKIFTPSLGSILPGITRDAVMKIAKDQGIEVEERKISSEFLKSADEAFFSGTAVEICSIGKIDNTLINQGKIGKITKKIKEIYMQTVKGERKEYLDWITFL